MTIIPTKLLGDCRVRLAELPANHFHLSVTSPPYWGLRTYKSDPVIWPLDTGCPHEWSEEGFRAGPAGKQGSTSARNGRTNTAAQAQRGNPTGQFCQRCGAWRGELGSEPTIELYIAHIVEVFRGVHRVLREDGTLWVNLGDSYASTGGHSDTKCNDRRGQYNLGNRPEFDRREFRVRGIDGLKPKDLCMVPARVAIALQADGWYLRSQIPWIKRNPLPESVTDRPGTAVEYVYLFSKSERYFYDRHNVTILASVNTRARVTQAVAQEAREDSKQETYRQQTLGGRKSRERTPNEILRSMAASEFPGRKVRGDHRRRRNGVGAKAASDDRGNRQNASFVAAASQQIVGNRNRRNSDWFMESFQGLIGDSDGNPMAFIVNPSPTKILHFAAYPPKLVEPIIKCATSDGGCCSECGAPRERVIEDGKPDEDWKKACGADSNGEYNGQNQKLYTEHQAQPASDVKERILRGMSTKKTTGWKSTCQCSAKTVPCRVLDPFSGTATTLAVATKLTRESTGCEINPQYLKDSDIRDAQGALAII